jgi:hypothetical protein
LARHQQREWLRWLFSGFSPSSLFFYFFYFLIKQHRILCFPLSLYILFEKRVRLLPLEREGTLQSFPGRHFETLNIRFAFLGGGENLLFGYYFLVYIFRYILFYNLPFWGSRVS